VKPETALVLQEKLSREIAGLGRMIDQLSQPDSGSTLAGLKSGLAILARAQQRTNQILHDVVRASVTPPSAGNPFDRLFR